MTDQALTTRTNYDRLKAMVKAEDVRARFADILGERAPQFLASILSAVATNDNLRDCDPGSILTSALKAAVLDLPIDQSIGFAWIIPYKDHGVPKAQFQIGYRGFIQLALRTNQYEAINAVEIYEGEEIKVDRLSGRVILNGKRAGDEVIGYVAYFKLLGGFEKFLYMTVKEIEAHRNKFAKGIDRPDSAWKTNFSGMAKKTVLKSLLTHYGIMSIQMQKAIATDAQVEGEPEARPLSEVIDGAFADPEPEQAPEPPAEQEPPKQPAAARNAEDDTAAWVVEQGFAQNEHEAKNIIKKCKLQNPTEAELSTWMRSYRGWRDIGAKPDQAAEYANKGEAPK